MSQRKAQRNILNKKEQLQKTLSETNEEDDIYSSMFATVPKEPELEKAPSSEEAIDITKLKAAPKEWNFYSPLPDDKMYELIESISSIGLQNRIIVWEDEAEDSYLVLSGHNRLKAYEMIYESTKDEAFSQIPAKIYKHDDINIHEAKEIIVDTNFVQRSLKPIERAQSIVAKINIVDSRRRNGLELAGRTRDIVAERYGLKGRMVENYKKLTELIPPFMELVNQGEITLKAGISVSLLSKEDQEWLYDTYNDELDSAVLSKIRKGMSRDAIADLFKKKEDESKQTNVRVSIPFGYEKDFVESFEKWAKSNKLSQSDFKIHFK